MADGGGSTTVPAGSLPPTVTLHDHGTVVSTLDVARDQVRAGAPAWTVVRARAQAGGRGRGGRVWHSPEGNLYLTIVLRPAGDMVLLPQLSLVSALAVADAVADLVPGAPLTLKWPNDVLADGAKLSGILLETVPVPGEAHPALLIGIGINLAHVPSDAGRPVDCLDRLAGHPVSRDAATAVLLHCVMARYEQWRRDGFAAVRPDWLARAATAGSAMTVHVGTELVSGAFAGLDADGALLLGGATGVRRIAAGEIVASGPVPANR